MTRVTCWIKAPIEAEVAVNAESTPKIPPEISANCENPTPIGLLAAGVSGEMSDIDGWARLRGVLRPC